MDISEIRSGIEGIAANAVLYEITNFCERADAIDFLEFHILDRIDGLLQQMRLVQDLLVLRIQAEKVSDNLAGIDARLFQQMREKVRTCNCTGPSFGDMISTYLGDINRYIDSTEKIGYDNLDIFINGLLTNSGDSAVPAATLPGEADMVFYQKTPARILFELVAQVPFSKDDVFVDLGSGLGQAVLLVHLLSGVTATGIEYEPAFCRYARACAARLKLEGITFINADVRQVNYSAGTIFYLYTPFEGAMLRDMLEILQVEAQKRTIRIFTYGFCSASVAEQSWLHCIKGWPEDPYQLCGFACGYSYLSS